MRGYISEVDYRASAQSNFVEIVVPSSVNASDYSLVVYDKKGALKGTFTLREPHATIAGKNVFILDNWTKNWVNILHSDALALIGDDGGIIQFIGFKDSVKATQGPASGLTAEPVGQHAGKNESLVTNDEGQTYSPAPKSTKGFIPCFAPGTLIRTDRGERPVETLVAGDVVITLDHGPQVIRWTNRSNTILDSEKEDAKPVLIRANALGPNLPKRDLVVSPQHRILVGGNGILKHFFRKECLVPAKALTEMPGIRYMRGRSRLVWHHFSCDRHELILADGCPAESLLLGPMVVEGLSGLSRRILSEIYGERRRPSEALNGPAARKCVSVGAARSLLLRQQERRTAARNWPTIPQLGGIRSVNEGLSLGA